MTAFTESDLRRTIVDRFEEQVAEHGSRIAVTSNGIAITYEELNRRANRQARAILAACGEGDQIVALLLGHDTPLIEALFGAAKAGKIYLCLNPDDPPVRTAAILNDSGARVLVTQRSLAAQAREACPVGVQILYCDEIRSDLPDGNPGVDIRAEQPCALHYTSASTGAPKGVLVAHAFGMHFGYLAPNFQKLHDGDRLGLHFSCGFAYSLAPIFGALLNGLSLHMFNMKAEGLSRMVAWARDEKINYLAMTPSLFRPFAASLPDGPNLPELRRISIGGEIVRKSDIELARRRISTDCVMVHQYGATETGTAICNPIPCSTNVQDEVLPIGVCTFGFEAVILDEDNQPVQRGQVGELSIKGRHVALGYWRRPEATARAFAQDPLDPAARIFRTGDLVVQREDGLMVHKGRRDFMRKIRGQRVEIEEIENVLAGVPGVAKSAITVRPDATGEDRLIAYVTPAGATPLTVAQLRANMQRLLPEHMLPSAFVFLGDLPLTPHGKVDRQALPDPPSEVTERETSFASPRNQVEQRLVSLWENALSVRPVGVKDNFFELGGNSLSAAQLFVQIERTFGKSLPLPLLLRAPTIELLAAHLTEGAMPHDWSMVMPLQPEGKRPPLFCIDMKNGGIFGHLAHKMGPDQPVFALHPLGLNGKTTRFTIPSIAKLFLEEVRRIQPEGPYHFCGLCAGAIVAYEMAQQLKAVGQDVPLLVMLDAFCPSPSLLPYPLARALDKFYWRQWTPFRDHAKRILHMNPREQATYIRQAMRESREKTAAKAACREARYKSNAPGDRYLRELRAYLHVLNGSTRKACLTYTPKPWPGRLILVLAEETNIVESSVGTRMGWRKLASQVEMHTVAGMHEHILVEPGVDILARIIQSYIV